MRKLVLGLVAAGTLLAAPAAAQVVIEGPGVGVRVGPGSYYYDYGWDRRHYYYYVDDWKERNCRTITVRERRADGRVIVRTRERC